MATHRSLTDAYLAGWSDQSPAQPAPDGPVDGASVAGASSVGVAVHDSVTASSYLGRSLSRPVFLGKAEYDQLCADVENIYQAIVELPQRLFGGDPAAFARAVGMTEEQVHTVLRGGDRRPSRLCRADFYLDETGFRMLEINIGSTMGGLDNALLNEGMLTEPYIADFVARHQLHYVDTMAELAQTLLAECEIADGVRPMMAAADWPPSFTTLEPQLHKSADMLQKVGIDAYACHAGQLSYADGRVWLGQRPVDVVYRLFSMENLHSELGQEVCEPVMAAVDRGEVAMFTHMDGRLYGSKGALAMLSDESNRHLLTDAERSSVDRVLPWTRMLRPGPVTVDGETVDLERYVLAEREELVLKPTLLYSGRGVVAGWLTEPEPWREAVEAAMGGPYLVQRRVRPIPEQFPTDAGPQDWTLVWGLYLMTSGSGGIWVRGTEGAISGVTNMAQGATATCCFIAST